MNDLEKKKALEVLMDDLRFQRYQFKSSLRSIRKQHARFKAAHDGWRASGQKGDFEEKLEESLYRLGEKQLVLESNVTAIQLNIEQYEGVYAEVLKRLNAGEVSA